MENVYVAYILSYIGKFVEKLGENSKVISLYRIDTLFNNNRLPDLLRFHQIQSRTFSCNTSSIENAANSLNNSIFYLDVS